MALTIITGKFGGGKSYYATDRVLKHFRQKDKRPLMVSLHLVPSEIERVLDGEIEGSVLPMIHFLGEEEIYRFWRHRITASGERYLWDVREKVTAEGTIFENMVKRPDDIGVVYVIDDAQDHFRSTDWKLFGREATHYLYQHRKLSDDIWMITPVLSYLVKPVRLAAQEYVEVRNLSKERVSWFKLPPLFMRSVFLSPPTGKGDRAAYSGVMRMDFKEVGKCFESAKGVGVEGGQADKGRSAKGVPVWVIVPLALVFAWLLWQAPKWFTQGLNKAVQPKGLAIQQAIEKTIPSSAPVSNAAPVVFPAPGERESVRRSIFGPDCVAMIEGAKGVTFYLSDGTQLDNPKGAKWDGTELEWKGVRYRWRP